MRLSHFRIHVSVPPDLADWDEVGYVASLLTHPSILPRSDGAQRVSVEYFSAVTFLVPLLTKVVGATRTAAAADFVDRLVKTRRSPFKFVLVQGVAQSRHPALQLCRS